MTGLLLQPKPQRQLPPAGLPDEYMVPPVLKSIVDGLRDVKRISILNNWEEDDPGRWHLLLLARLSGKPSQHMPSESKWRLVVSLKQPDGGVFYYPDAEDGIHDTFRHQDQNSCSTGAIWRAGKPCLERPIRGLGRDEWGDEPRTVEAAAIWKARRLLQWIDAAAADSLASLDSTNELPAGLGQGSRTTIGFLETTEDLGWASSTPTRWGFASLVPVPGTKSTWALTELFDERSNPHRKFDWGMVLSETSAAINTVWLLAPDIPVKKPWTAPTTWAELTDLLDGQGVDLVNIMAEAGARYRAGTRRTEPHRLVIGFPFASRIGQKPQRLHWLMIDKMPLAGRKEKRHGFRPKEESRRLWDRRLAVSNTALGWLKTENWAPDQLQSRGGAEDRVKKCKILIIGAGSLGSAVAENLCRAGALKLSIMDGEKLNIGNLTRHVLTMADAGHNKADALVKRLNRISPNARTTAVPYDFKAEMNEAITKSIRAFDVIVDCTGSDDLLEHLSSFDWQSDKLFISLSVTWGANGLLAFCAHEQHFPVVDAKYRFAEVDAPIVRYEDANVEGIGCWHPVFPADSDDVQQWAALSSKFIRSAILNPDRRLTYYRRADDGAVEVINA